MSKTVKLNEIWRPLAGLGLSVTAVLLPWGILCLHVMDVIKTPSDYVGLYGTLCTLLATLAGIRQFNKHKEADIEIQKTKMRFDAEEEAYKLNEDKET